MSKVRLEEADFWLKSMYDLLSVKTDEEDRAYTQKRIDLFNWLIEQAERFEKMKQEFSEDIDFKRREVLGLTERVQELEEIITERHETVGKWIEKSIGLEQQNKRYRDALQQIKEATSHNKYWKEIAFKALESETDGS